VYIKVQCVECIVSVVDVSSVVPLIGDSLGILMQRQPKELDDVLPGCFHRVRCGMSVSRR